MSGLVDHHAGAFAPLGRIGQHAQGGAQGDLLERHRLRHRLHATRSEGVADIFRGHVVSAAVAERVFALLAQALIVNVQVCHATSLFV
jgi:hypothetical protein